MLPVALLVRFGHKASPSKLELGANFMDRWIDGFLGFVMGLCIIRVSKFANRSLMLYHSPIRKNCDHERHARRSEDRIALLSLSH
jgi:hypothetical protein